MSGELTFEPDISPSYDLTDNRQPRVWKQQYGDGYVLRARVGINHDAAKVTVKWDNITTAEMESIWDFLTARGGDEAFLYDMPMFDAGLKWTCDQYSRSLISPDVYSVTALFEQDFTP